MSAKTFLIAHGEKIAVVAVAGGCALALWGAIDDPTIRPKDNQQQIEAINAKIDKVFKTQSPPVMKEPRPYLDQLLARVAETAPITPTMAWLTNPPDKGRGIVVDPKDPNKINVSPPPSGTFLYIYELLTPTVAIEDAIGSLHVTVTPPTTVTTGGQGRRISSDADKRWTREEKGQIVNTARHLGVQVQIKVGDNEWKPLVLPGASKDGVLPIAGKDSAMPTTGTGAAPASSLNKEITIPTPEPWQRHKLRARIIAAATALDLEAKLARPKLSVVVHPGSLSTGPTEDPAILDKTLAQVQAQDGTIFKALLRPEAGPLPASAKLTAGEKLFLGPWSPVAEVDATASVRFALVGLSTAPTAEDPSKSRDVGRFLLLRLFQQGTERKWMEKPLEERFGVGDVLGLPEVTMPNPFGGGKISTDLMTPFVIDKLIKDQKRVLYWTVQPKARQPPSRDRDLALDKKEVSTDIVVLKNPDTGSELTLTKLISIVPPSKADTLIYPHRAAAYVEKDEFTKAPSEFRQWGLIPEEPKAFQPGTGPLEELFKVKLADGALDAPSFRTDTAYYVFPDGRVAWWELVEHKLKVHDPEGVMSAKAAPAAAPAEPEAPAPGAPKPPANPKAALPLNGPTLPPGFQPQPPAPTPPPIIPPHK